MEMCKCVCVHNRPSVIKEKSIFPWTDNAVDTAL